MGTNPPIEAAGGVLWREDGARLLIAVIHRERFDDWSLPKGKLEAGELAIRAAIREVGEECGSQVSVTRRLGETRYPVDGAAKRVRFWAMRHDGGEFAPNDEVDELQWLAPADARHRLSYAGEQAVVDSFTTAAVPLSTVVLIRHAKAGKRSEWSGPDIRRPLDAAGRARAEVIGDFAQSFAPVHIRSAEPVRCVQTVQPLADRLELPIEVDAAFSDKTSALDTGRSRDALAALVADGIATAVCSQGDTIAALIDESTSKGAAWVLGCRDGQIVSRDYYGAGAYRRR